MSRKAIDYVLMAGIFIIAFCSPLALDMKLTRYKLTFIETGALLFALVWIVRIILDSEVKLSNTFTLPVAAYFIVSLFFYLISNDRLVGRNELERAFLAFFIFIPGAFLIDKKTVRTAVFLLVISTFLISAYGYFQRSGGFWKIAVPQSHRVMSTFGNPDFFGAYLALALPLLLSYFIVSAGYRKFIGFLAAVLSFISLYYTESRGALLGVIAAFFFYILFVTKKAAARRLVISGFIVLSIAYAYSVRRVIFRGAGEGEVLRRAGEIFSIKEGKSVIGGLDELFGTDRLKIWRDTLRMAERNPGGVGPGAFHIYFPKNAGDDLKAKLPQDRFIVNYAHNEYIEILAETGFVGLGIFIWLVAVFVRFLVEARKKYLKSAIKKDDYLLIAGLSSGIIALLIHNMFDVNFRFVVNWAYVIFFLALLPALFSSAHMVVFKPSGGYSSFFRVIFIAMAVSGSYFSVRKILEPYRAHREVSSEVDFFDQRIQNAKDESDLLKARIAKNPGDAEAYQKLAWIYAKEIERKDEKGNKVLNREMARLAVDTYIAALKVNPSLFGAYNNIGNIFFTVGDREKAIENYRRSLAINPEQIDARINLSLAYYYRGMLKEASDELKHVLRLEPNNSKAIILLKKMVE